jgi:hypothetical protein
MRAMETSKVLSWRWAPCLALALGAGCFSGFLALVIPERIGSVATPVPGSAAFTSDASLASSRTFTEGASRFSSAEGSDGTSNAHTPMQGAARAALGSFPKRGFSPPLERPEPPPPSVVPQPQPVLQVPPPVVTEAVQVPPPEAQPPQAPPPQAPSDPQAAAALIEQGVRPAD